eukprot:Seg15127.1 transcript_id=Seg15127.1/GoldUCD/mRNA.D3Y31 product="hypothetical protein" protein_id=Seg15127.1/GoldUCD/D3Y31
MSSTTSVITIKDLGSDPIPTMLLRQPKVPGGSESSAWSKPMDTISSWFTKAKGDVHLEEGVNPEITRRNQAKIDKMFDGMIKDMNQQREKVKTDLEKLTPEEQEQVLTFWGGVHEFMGKLLGWLKSMFNKVLEKIKQGWQLIKDTVKSIFNTVFDAITNAFK